MHTLFLFYKHSVFFLNLSILMKTPFSASKYAYGMLNKFFFSYHLHRAQQFGLLCSNFWMPSKRFSHLKMHSISNVCNCFNCFARPVLYLNWMKAFLWQINVFLYEIFPSLSRFLYIIPFQNVWAPKVEAGIMLTLCVIFWDPSALTCL